MRRLPDTEPTFPIWADGITTVHHRMGSQITRVRGKGPLPSQPSVPVMTTAATVTISDLSYAVRLKPPTLIPLNLLPFGQDFPQNKEPR